MEVCKRVIQKFESLRPFTEEEAWLLFRLGAYAEALGWTMLISGIAIERYITPGNDTAVLIAGQTHGMLFFGYLVAALGLYPSLGWSRWRGLMALAASVPPFGTLVFEVWVSQQRHNAGFKSYRHYMVYTVLTVAVETI